MISKIAFFICIQFAVLNVAYPQCLDHILANYGPNISPITENLLPNLMGNQLKYLPYDLPYEIQPNVFPGALQPNILPLPNVLQQLPNVLQQRPNVLQSALPSYVAPTTIIQDSTVANNLANALQLLVVSNLLSNTLPQAADRYPPIEFISPAPCGSGGYNYIF